MAVNIRLKGIVDTLANIAADKFAGRIAWATDLARMIWYYDATNYGTMARRDILETFAAGIQDSTITNGQALVAGASGRIQSQEAATFRTTIGAIATGVEVLRECAVVRRPGTGTAEPVPGNWVDANMQVPYWGGNVEQIDRAYFYVDVDHSYKADSDIHFHMHWGPTTTGGGNVKLSCYYQWGEGGATWTAATLTSATVAAGTTKWGDKTTNFTIPGAGKTYNSRLLVHIFRDRADAADTYEAAIGEIAVSGHFTSVLDQAGEV